MEQLDNYSVCYNYYDKKGRRLSTFCRFTSEVTAEIFTIVCSKSDKFKKASAKQAYEQYLKGEEPTINGETVKFNIVEVIIQPEERELKTLLNYCMENYFFYVLIDMPTEVLVPANIFNLY